MDTNTVPLDQIPDIAHPRTDLALSDVIRLAQNYQKLRMNPAPKTLEDVRTTISHMVKTAMHNWMTGQAALDLLESVLDGKDLTKQARFY